MQQHEKDTYHAAPYDALAQDYDQGLEKLLGVFGGNNEKYAEYKVELLRRLLPGKICSILDFGCGTGRSLSFFRKHFSLSGCDISRESLKIASQRDPEAQIFLCTSVEELKTHEKQYDLVFLSCVLHHMEPGIRDEWMGALAEKLVPGGHLAVFEHNLKNPCTRRIVHDPENSEDNPEFMMTPAEVSALLSRAGIRREWSGYTLFSPFRRPWVTSLERYLAWCPLGAQFCVMGTRE